MPDRDKARPRERPSVREAIAHATELLARFEMEGVIGAGGMGVVVSARDLVRSQRVAIKLLRDPTALDSSRVTRMLREARLGSALQSPHAVRILEAGTLANGGPYSVMEYLEGADLAARLRSGPLAVSLAVDIVVQACDALAEAHAAGVVHRDLKPSNLFLVDTAEDALFVKVLDFGIARETAAQGLPLSTLTDSEVVLGTPAYMAPEQIRGLRPLDARVDVWALGVILYEALSHATPFRGVNVADLLVRIVSEPHPSLQSLAPHVPAGLVAVVDSCLEKERERRPGCAARLSRLLAPYASPRSAAALRAAMQREPVPEEPTTRATSLRSGTDSGFASVLRQNALRASMARGRLARLAILGLVASGGVALWRSGKDDGNTANATAIVSTRARYGTSNRQASDDPIDASVSRQVSTAPRQELRTRGPGVAEPVISAAASAPTAEPRPRVHPVMPPAASKSAGPGGWLRAPTTTDAKKAPAPAESTDDPLRLDLRP